MNILPRITLFSASDISFMASAAPGASRILDPGHNVRVSTSQHVISPEPEVPLINEVALLNAFVMPFINVEILGRVLDDDGRCCDMASAMVFDAHEGK
jgi:hypothetical protein